eukprot:SAG31_NODE_1218_length_9303_cov_4.349087_1_plen_869_part_10
MASAENIKVLLRVRPPADAEQQGGIYRKAVAVTAPNCVNYESAKDFTFDHCCDETTSQDQIFDMIGKPMTEACLNGYNATIFAYGQTGSGKTYTMEGSTDTIAGAGMIPRVFQHLFERIESEQSKTVKVSCMYLEIYNEQLTDLLNPSNGQLTLREDGRKEIQIEGAKEVEVSSAAETYEILHQGSLSRHVAVTNMNKESSRSHSVFILKLQTEETDNGTKTVRSSRFNLIDLAGSERQKTAKTEGATLKEASAINKSLSVLGHVINALVDEAKGKGGHVPYRNSKLTFLLRDSLGGNSKTCIVANVSPASKNSEETLSTLQFAQRAKTIKNEAVVNENTSGDTAALSAEIVRLRAENASLLAEQQQGMIVESDSAVPIAAQVEEMENLLKQAFLQNEFQAQELGRVQETVTTLKDTVEKQKEHMQSKDMVIKFRESEISQLKRKLNGDSAPLSLDHATEIAELRKQLASNPQLQHARLEAKELSKKLSHYQDLYAKEDHARDEKMESLEAFKIDLQKQMLVFMNQKAEYEASLTEMTQMAESVAAQSQVLQAEKQALNSQKVELETTAEELMGMVESQQKDLDTKSTCITSLEERNAAQMHQIETLTTEVTSKSSHCDELEVELVTCRLKIDTVANEHTELTAKHESTAEELKNSLHQLEQLQQTASEQTNTISQLETAKQSLEGDLSEKTAEFERLAEEKQATDAELEQSKQSLVDAEAASAEAKASFESKIEELTGTLEQTQETLSAEQQTVAEQKDTITELRTSLETANASIASGEEQLAAASEERDTMSAELTASQQQIEELTQASQTQAAEMTATIEAKEAEIDQQSSTIAQLETAKQSLEGDLSEKTAEFERLAEEKQATDA